MIDDHYKLFEEACENLEKTYGLDKELDGRKVSDLDVTELISHIQAELASKGDDIITERNNAAFNYIGLVSHLSERIEFFKQTRVDYRNYPHRTDILKAMRNFTDYETLKTTGTLNNGNIVASVLDKIDKKHVDLRYRLAYRYLRMILVMLVYQNFVELSILARFIITQVERSE